MDTARLQRTIRSFEGIEPPIARALFAGLWVERLPAAPTRAQASAAWRVLQLPDVRTAASFGDVDGLAAALGRAGLVVTGAELRAMLGRVDAALRAPDEGAAPMRIGGASDAAAESAGAASSTARPVSGRYPLGTTGELGQNFWPRFNAMARRLGVDPYALGGVIESESLFQPAIRNPVEPTAYGILQATPDTLKGLGFTDDPMEFLRLTGEEQLPYVERYFAPWRGRMLSPGVVYGVVFLPNIMRARGTSPDTVLAAKDAASSVERKAYAANGAYLDVDGDGAITIADLDRKVAQIQATGHFRKIADAIARAGYVRASDDAPPGDDAPPSSGGSNEALWWLAGLVLPALFAWKGSR